MGLNGAVIMGLLFFIMAEPCLWMIRTEGFMRLEEMFHLATRPDGIYGRTVRLILTAIPLTVTASFPARLMVKTISLWEIGWSFASVIILAAVSRKLWIYGLRRYESASS
jgi:ABC-type uncharacterized transport system permease subunit